MTTKIIKCGCGREMGLIETLVKTSGYQRSEYVVGRFKLYQCRSCGQTYWEFETER